MSEEEDDQVAIVRCGTTKGPIAFKFYRHWSPHGYDRAVELFERGFYDNSHFFRMIPDFLVQFGISYTSDEELADFADTEIPDDPQLDPPIDFDEGIISFAGSGDNSRDSHLFIAFDDEFGESPWETPVGEVIEGMENILRFDDTYGDEPPDGEGPPQEKIYDGGPTYIEENFPKLDRFTECVVVRNPLEQPKLATVDRETKTDPVHENSEDDDINPELKSHQRQLSDHNGGTMYAGFFGLVAVISMAAMASFRLGRRNKGTKAS